MADRYKRSNMVTGIGTVPMEDGWHEKHRLNGRRWYWRNHDLELIRHRRQRLEKGIGYPSWHSAAKREYNRAYYALFSDELRQYARRYRRRPGMRKKLREAARKRHLHDREAGRTRKWQAAYSRRLRLECLYVYGGRCMCCGEDREQFLTLDHVNGGGYAHGKRVGRGLAIYRDLRHRGWPKDGYQLLCMNCNWAKRRGSVCPHVGEVVPIGGCGG